MDCVTRHDDIRAKALADLQRYEVLMLNGHFDFGNGYHGTLYLNPHQLFRYPSTIWRFAQDLLDVLPASILAATEVVAGPVTGGALLGHTMAGLLDAARTYVERGGGPDPIERAIGADVLALDDLGAERPTDWALDRLSTLVDARYAAGRPILAATNLPVEEWHDAYGDRVASRLVEMTEPTLVGGVDLRIES
jgi:hypothetical protein